MKIAIYLLCKWRNGVRNRDKKGNRRTKKAALLGSDVYDRFVCMLILFIFGFLFMVTQSHFIWCFSCSLPLCIECHFSLVWCMKSIYSEGPSWPWLHGIWIYNYLCNHYPSPLMWVRISIRSMCTALCDKVCQWLATGWWFSSHLTTL
jgi:hypothetical protein